MIDRNDTPKDSSWPHARSSLQPSPSSLSLVIGATMSIGVQVTIALCLTRGIIPKEEWKYAIGAMLIAILPSESLISIGRESIRRLIERSKP